MSEGFYSRKTGEVWDEVIEDWEMGAEEDALDKARALTTQLDEALGIAERKIRRLLPLAARWPAVSEEQALAEADYFRREHDREPTDEERASVERFREFLRQARSNEGPENLHSWQAKAERYEATCVRLTRERDDATAKIAALTKEHERSIDGLTDRIGELETRLNTRYWERVRDENIELRKEAETLNEWLDAGAKRIGDLEAETDRLRGLIDDQQRVFTQGRKDGAADQSYRDAEEIAALQAQIATLVEAVDRWDRAALGGPEGILSGERSDATAMKMVKAARDVPEAAKAWKAKVRADERERCASACDDLRDKTISALVIRCLGDTGGK